jgi:TPR repeat protein
MVHARGESRLCGRRIQSRRRRGVAADPTQAFELFRRSAEKGNTAAQYNLAVMYAQGRGVTVDNIEAQKWFSIAASLGDSDAGAARDQIAAALSPEQAGQAQERANQWLAEFQSPELRRP